MMKFRFKEEYSLEQRREEAHKVLSKNLGRLPIVAERVPHSDVPQMDVRKFLVPVGITVSQFCWIIRKRIRLQPDKALFIQIGRSIPPCGATMGQLYNEYKEEDDFMYVAYASETTFG